MKDRRKSKRTFIRYAGKAIFALDYVVVVMQLVLMYQGKTVEHFSMMYAFLTFITGFIFGAAGWSDHRKETSSITTSSPGIVEREP